MFAKISAAQAMSINLARAHASNEDRKAMKREIFADVKRAFGIPADHHLVVETDQGSSNYCVVKNRDSRQPYTIGNDGRWVSALSGASDIEYLWVRIGDDDLVNTLRDHIASGDEYLGVARDKPSGNPILEDIQLDDDGDVWVRIDRDDLDQDHLADEHDL